MSINYATIRETLQALEVARARCNRIASTQIGVISGGIDLSEDWREVERLCETGFAMVEAAFDGGARLSHLAAVIAEYDTTPDIRDLIRNAQSEVEYRRRHKYSR